jgi:hypothetical protein
MCGGHEGSALTEESVRLPKSIVPRKYTLVYDRVDLERFYFDGQVTTDVDVVEVRRRGGRERRGMKD